MPSRLPRSNARRRLSACQTDPSATNVGYVSRVSVDAKLRALHRHVHGAFERPEVGREGEMLLRIQLLLRKYQTA